MTSETCLPLPPTLHLADLPAREPVLLPPYTASGMDARWPEKCLGSLPSVNGLSWSSRRETRRGKITYRACWQELADTLPELSSRLATLARHIRDGACTSWPAPACRDWRSPGDRSHPRLSASRGQQMPELIGERISWQLYLWSLALPATWIEAPAADGGKKRLKR